jgi:hypothetical protein
MSLVPKDGVEDSRQLQSITERELDQIEEQDPQAAQELLEGIWGEAKEFLEGAGFSVPEETEVRLNPTEILKRTNGFDPQTYDIKISSKSQIHPFFGDESSVFGTLVHEGVHSTQFKHVNSFIDEVSSIPDPQNVGTITNKSYLGLGSLGDEYFWSALEAKSGDRIGKIVDHTVEEYEKWENQHTNHSNQLENTEFAQLFWEGGRRPTIGSTSGLNKTPEQLKEHLVSWAESNPDLLELHNISEQEYFSKIDDHIEEYSEHREKIREGEQYREEVIERFEQAMYRELELHDIDSTEYDGNIEEVFSCFMEYCAERGLDDKEEISRYTESLNDYAEGSDDLPEVAKQLFSIALDQESEEEARETGSEVQDRVLVEGDYILSK